MADKKRNWVLKNWIVLKEKYVLEQKSRKKCFEYDVWLIAEHSATGLLYHNLNFRKACECKLFLIMIKKTNNMKLFFFLLQCNFHVLRDNERLWGINGITHVFLSCEWQYLQCDSPCEVFNMLICLLSHWLCLEKSTAACLQFVPPSFSLCTRCITDPKYFG